MNIHLGHKRDFFFFWCVSIQAPDGIHFFAFSSGVLLCIAATENAISGAMSRRSLLHVFFAGIIFLSGLLIIALEHQGGGVVFSPRATAFVTQNFLFLRFITGRGCFIVYIGSVQAAIHCEYFLEYNITRQTDSSPRLACNHHSCRAQMGV